MLTEEVRKFLGYIGANVRRERERKELTQEDLMGLTKFDPRFIRLIERGQGNMTIETLVRLAKALEVSPAALLRPRTLAPPRPGRPPKKRTAQRAR
jgi:transcriptional regulator with XRE-family HTH domain